MRPGVCVHVRQFVCVSVERKASSQRQVQDRTAWLVKLAGPQGLLHAAVDTAACFIRSLCRTAVPQAGKHHLGEPPQQFGRGRATCESQAVAISRMFGRGWATTNPVACPVVFFRESLFGVCRNNWPCGCWNNTGSIKQSVNSAAFPAPTPAPAPAFELELASPKKAGGAGGSRVAVVPVELSARKRHAAHAIELTNDP